MTERDNDPFFRQLELVAGVEGPLSWDTRKLLPAYVDESRVAAAQALVYDDANRAVPYLAELFGLPETSSYGQVYDELRRRRAKAAGLPGDAPFDTIRRKELKTNHSMLTMSQLRKERDQRLDTYVPVVNTPEW